MDLIQTKLNSINSLTVKQKLEYIVYLICALILVWVLCSFININIHNVDNYNYANWNLLAKLF